MTAKQILKVGTYSGFRAEKLTKKILFAPVVTGALGFVPIKFIEYVNQFCIEYSLRTLVLLFVIFLMSYCYGTLPIIA